VLNLTGNVEEWVDDNYGPYASAPQNAPLEDPLGPASGELRITRGGCLFSGLSDTDFEYGGIGNFSRTTQDPSFDWG